MFSFRGGVTENLCVGLYFTIICKYDSFVLVPIFASARTRVNFSFSSNPTSGLKYDISRCDKIPTAQAFVDRFRKSWSEEERFTTPYRLVPGSYNILRAPFFAIGFAEVVPARVESRETIVHLATDANGGVFKMERFFSLKQFNLSCI